MGHLAGILLSAKASAVAGVMILAGGAVVSASAGAGVTALMQQPTPTPIVEVVGDENTGDVDQVDAGDPPADEPEDVTDLPEPDCDEEGIARDAARERIDAAFVRYDAGLDELRAKLGGKGSASTYAAIDSSDALLAEIQTQADAALDDVGLCVVEVASIGEIAFQGAGALALVEVSDNAVAAMETVYNLARSTVMAELERLSPKATPKPTPKWTEKPRDEKKWEQEQARKKESQRCDETVYAAKNRLHKAFEQYHGANDKLIWELKKWASDSAMGSLHRNDEILHRTYDGTRERILHAGCNTTGEGSGMALAERAEVLFRQTYEGSRGVAQAASVNKPDRKRCEEQMYAAKKVLYANFETFHGGNDRLWKVMDGFSESTSNAIKTADRIIHETYDRTKGAIYEAPCGPNGSNAMELAANAAGVFETVHNEARRAVGRELSEGGDR
jgi:hypothetical protein